MKNLFTKISVVVAAMAIFVGCQNEKEIKTEISGQFVGSEAEMVYLEAGEGTERKVVDSVALDKSGNYSFEIKEAAEYPTLYYVVYNERHMPLLVSRGEKVALSAEGNSLENYTVSGSPESELLRSFNKEHLQLRKELKATMEKIGPAKKAAREELMQQYRELFLAMKQKQISFIIEHKSSVAAVYALYQRVPGDTTLSGSDVTDAIHYRTVLEAVSQRYPNAPLVQKLKLDVERMAVLQTVEVRSYPELKGADIYGNEHTLSSLEGNVILVDFWSAASGFSNPTNADLKEVYKKYEPKGFRIYQVSADISKATWVTAVVEQHLPWVSVCDFKGAASPMVLAYNVKKLPANFLIDREGNIVDKNLYGKALEKKLAAMFK